MLFSLLNTKDDLTASSRNLTPPESQELREAIDTLTFVSF